MVQAAALLAARHLQHWEIIDYSSAGRVRCPQRHRDGSWRATGRRLGSRSTEVPVRCTRGGELGALGATVACTQVHSLRLPSFVVSTEIVFVAGLTSVWSIRHDAWVIPAPYVAGALRPSARSQAAGGLTRGLATLLTGGSTPGQPPGR